MKKVASSIRKTGIFLGQNFVSALFFWVVKVFIRPKIDGLDQLKKMADLCKSSKWGVIFASNHINKSDPLLILHSMPIFLKLGLGPIIFLGKAELFNSWWKNKLMRSLGVVPVKGSSLLGLREIVSSVKRGEKIFYFPEGHVSENGNCGKDSGTASFIARHTSFIFQPVRVSGIQGWKRDWKNIFLFRRKYEVCFLKPFIVEKGSQLNALAETQKGTQNYVSDSKGKGD